MRVVSDSVRDPEAVLEEMLSAIDTSWALCEACTPIQVWMRTAKQRKSPPVYVAETGKKMRENFIEDFRTAYPTLSVGIMNGRLGSTSYRMHDGIYKLGTCLKTIKDCKFMVMSDDQRQVLYDAFRDIVADFTIYTIIAFQLHRANEDVCTLSVSKACERRKVSPAILYGELLETLKRTGRTYYAYEPLSSVYADMLAVEPAFMAECEEQELPLTEELAQGLLDGETTVPQLMELLQKQNADVVSTEVDVNPISMISRMNLE